MRKKLPSIMLDAEQLRQQIEKALIERSLYSFVKAAWPIVEPEIEFKENWHITAICDHLQAVARGDITQLIINVPPATMKSLICCVFFPCWVWTTAPSSRFIFASYSDSLTMRDSVKCRNIITSEWWQTRWPMQLRGDQNTKGMFENEQGGWRMATSVGGRATGLHPDYFCFHPETLILCRDGWRQIGQVVEQRTATEVASYNHATGRTEWRAILDYEKHGGRPSLTVTTERGRRITCTQEHPFFVEGKGYVQAAKLHAGDKLKFYGQDLPTLQSGIQPEAEPQKPVLLGSLLPSGQGQKHNPMPALPEGILAITEAPAARQQLLLTRLLRGIKHWFQSPSKESLGSIHLPQLRQGIPATASGSKATSQEKILLTSLPIRRVTEAAGAEAMQGMRQSIFRKAIASKAARILLKAMRLGQPRQTDTRSSERSLRSREMQRPVSGGIQETGSTGTDSGRQPLRSLRSDQQEAAGRSPHQLRQEGQHTDQPDDGMHEMPRTVSRQLGEQGAIEADTVLKIEPAPQPEYVYNLNVAGNNNYFA